MRELAVDFGTSNTVAALRTDAWAHSRLLSTDGWPVLPSAVWLAPDGALVVGRDAVRQARLDPARFEPNPKRRIDEVEVLLGDTVVPVVDLIAAVLRRTLDEARRELGGVPDRLVLTHPAGWGAVRRRTLTAAARRAGAAGEIRLLPEPVAAAAHFATLPGHELAVSAALAVFDLGGGTTDTAVVARTADGWQVLAEAGLGDLGGGDLDQLLLDHVGHQVGAGRPELAARWTALSRPDGTASRRAARTLADDVRAAKEALSRYQQADVPLPPPLPDAHVTRVELERLATPWLERAAALLSSTIAAAGLRPADLAGVYLVGGASRMPLVAQLLSARLGILPVAVESPESSVVLGALTATQQRASPAPWTPTAPAAPAPVPAVAVPAAPVPAAPGAQPARRRRRVAIAALAMLGTVVLGGAAALAATSLRGDDKRAGATTTVTSPAVTSRPVTTTSAVIGDGDPQPPRAELVPLGQRTAAFGNDSALREFAGRAVDRALNCADPGGTAREIFGLRSQVQCVYRVGERPYYATFMAGDSAAPCEQLRAALEVAGTGGQDGEWSGGGRNGSLTEITITVPVRMDVLYYADSAGLLCGLVESEEADPMPRAELHGLWNGTIRPGS